MFTPYSDYSSDACRRAADALGKTQGGCGKNFKLDSHTTKGCHGYLDGHSKASCMFYGTIDGAEITDPS